MTQLVADARSPTKMGVPRTPAASDFRELMSRAAAGRDAAGVLAGRPPARERHLAVSRARRLHPDEVRALAAAETVGVVPEAVVAARVVACVAGVLHQGAVATRHDDGVF